MKQRNEMATKILTLLTQKKLTQKDLSALTGTSQAAISKILSGKHKTKVSTLEKLAKVLDVPITYFLDDSQKNFENTGIIGNNNSNNNFNSDMKDIKIQLQDHEIRLLKLENEILRKELKK